QLGDEALACFVQAERLDPNNPRWPYHHAGGLLNQRDYAGAVPYLKRALEHCDSERSPAVRLRLGETLLTLGQLEEAEVQFGEALTAQPQDARTHYNLGLLAVARQEWKTAHQHLLRCVDDPSTQQQARIQLALVCQRLGDTASASMFQQQAER